MAILAFLLLIVTAYYACAIIFLWRGLDRLSPAGAPAGLTFSIVIAARNEEENIGVCLESIFSQRLPGERYEVIVVDDRSTDATAAIVADFSRRHTNLRCITVAETPPGIAPKKHAVALGIAEAKTDVVVFTDADCLVQSTWLETIDRHFDATTGLVQGITVYAPLVGMSPLFFGLQAVDFLSHGIVAAAAIGAGMPLNSNANNFAFRKLAFADAGGYGAASQRVVSGDDDLLLQRIAACPQWQVRFMAEAAGAVATKPTPTVKGVFEQRKRWGSKTVHYTPRQVIFLSGIFLFYCGMAATLVAGIAKPSWFLAFAGMLAVKISGEFALMIPGTALFNQKSLRGYILPASFLQLPMVIAAVVLGVFGRFSWKGERFKRAIKAVL